VEVSRKRVIKSSGAKRNRRPFMPLFVRTRDFQNKSKQAYTLYQAFRRLPFWQLLQRLKILIRGSYGQQLCAFFDRLVFTVKIIMYRTEFIHAM